MRILTLLWLLSSCTYLLQKVDKDFRGHKSNLTFKTDLQTYCKEDTSLQLVSESKKNQQQFTNFIKNIEQKTKLSFIEKVVLWSLIQMNLRPDQSSPTSKLSLLISHHSTQNHYTFYGMSTETHSYILGLNYLLQEYKSSRSLHSLAKLLDRYYPDAIYVTQNLENFLTENRGQLVNFPEQKKLYMRGEETLRMGERLPKQNFANVIQAGLKSNKQNFKVEKKLIRYEYNLNTQIDCNFDMSLYKDNVYLINSFIIRSNIFGVKDHNSSFLASSGQKFEELKTMPNSSFFVGYSNTRIATLCTLQNKNFPKQKIWLASTQSRDPGQHIFHLLEYGIGAVNSLQEIDNLIRFSRHLFLKKPLRLIYESDRSLKSQTEELLKLNIPVYSANHLGQVWANLLSPDQNSFIIDERNESALTCLK